MTNGQTMHTPPGPSRFPTTRWTLVVAAGDPQRKEARSALADLCENYWYPLYAYLRRRGYAPDAAQDLTQEFFVRVLEGRYLDRADPEKGRFRSFILTSLKFFVADEGDRQRALKRGKLGHTAPQAYPWPPGTQVNPHGGAQCPGRDRTVQVQHDDVDLRLHDGGPLPARVQHLLVEGAPWVQMRILPERELVWNTTTAVAWPS